MVMTRVTEPSGARRMGPKLDGVGSVTKTVRVTILAFNVTAPIRADALPSSVASVASEID